jgi:hypothetical protein
VVTVPGRFISRGKSVRMAAVLMLALMVMIPVSSAYLNRDRDIEMTEIVTEESCYCHSADPDPNVTVIVDVPTQVAFTPTNDSVTVGVGVLGMPPDLTGFGLYLNTTAFDPGLFWNPGYANDTEDIPSAPLKVDVNGTAIWTVGKIRDRWFNLSFVPGRIEQDITLTVIGMRANEGGNESGDFWNLTRVTIETREQRILNLTVGVTNDGPVTADGVLVDFYIDDELLGNGTLPRLDAHTSENVTYEWDVTFVEDGKYKLRAVIDPEGRITETDIANNEVTRDIWLGGPPEVEDYSAYYGIGYLAVVLIVVVVVLWVWRRRQYRF